MMKRYCWLVMLLGMVLAGCKMTAGGIDINALGKAGSSLAQLGTISDAQELTLGDDFAAILLGASQLHPNEGLQHYVNSVGRYLASHSERPDLPWTFGVLDTPDLNAFAIPGGYVFITSGLMANLNSEAELAAVMAHEISHITERHHLRQLERDQSVDFISHLASAAITYQELRNPRDSRTYYRNRQITETVFNAGQQLFTKGLSREDELMADALAVRLLARTGYDPYALVVVLQKLQGIQGDSGGIRMLLETHPAPADRLHQIEQHLARLELQHASAVWAGLVIQQRYQEVLAGNSDNTR